MKHKFEKKNLNERRKNPFVETVQNINCVRVRFLCVISERKSFSFFLIVTRCYQMQTNENEEE